MTIQEIDALIVGGGFGGIRLTGLLKNQLQLAKVVAIEKGEGLGGTWYWNKYPGAQSDSESWVYGFSDDVDTPQPTTRYLYADDVQRQLITTAKNTNVLDNYLFENQVVSAHYDTTSSRWHITTDKGFRFAATYFITALGILSKPYIPNFPGIDTFQGVSFHSAGWPKGLNTDGKRVAIIGTGPSGSQITSAIHRSVESLVVFQKRAQYITPVENRALRDEEKDAISRDQAKIWNTVFNSLFAMGFEESNESALNVSEARRREVYEQIWNKGGGFRFFFEAFNDLGIDFTANETAAAFVREKIAEIVKDPQTASILQPTGAYGGRPLCADGYYEAFNNPNVSVVSIADNPISRIIPTGIELQDGTALEFDIIVFATGFDGVDGAYRDVDIRGRNGIRLSDVWQERPNALYGISVAEFPNFFTITGPGSPFANIPPIVEVQGDFVVRLIRELNQRGGRSIEANRDAELKWTELVQAVSRSTVFDKVRSWIQNNNVAGSEKFPVLFLGGLNTYTAKLEEEANIQYPSYQFLD
ncbi:hypothetical protein FE257_005393 [Aspergillus nanangensis]|uniref:Cyclohexanone monooxygenase n=1 Tax=Aspergillus nanangensis TaxID=2582783 RepID=A0AAD4CSC1_ASPNN|nr:hypothetical protein FE257_005393 [Aspergillus nanangensis]